MKYDVYAAESDVDIFVKDLYIDVNPKNYDPQNNVTVEVVAKKDIKTKISLFCAQSSDNLAYGEQKELTLKAGIKQTLTLEFSGWTRFSFTLEIRAENTKVSIFIDPNRRSHAPGGMAMMKKAGHWQARVDLLGWVFAIL